MGGVSGDGDGDLASHSSQLHSVYQSPWRQLTLRPVQLQLAGRNQLTRLIAVHTLTQHLLHGHTSIFTHAIPNSYMYNYSDYI